MTTALRSAVLGGVDGIITCFAVVAASSAGGFSKSVVTVIGFASLFGDATSMMISEYLAVRTDDSLRKNTALHPLLSAASCFAAFVVCGLVPLLTYLVTVSLLSSAAFSVTALILLGAARACVSREPLVHTLLETAALGTVAGAVAYGVGVLTHRLTLP